MSGSARGGAGWESRRPAKSTIVDGGARRLEAKAECACRMAAGGDRVVLSRDGGRQSVLYLLGIAVRDEGWGRIGAVRPRLATRAAQVALRWRSGGVQLTTKDVAGRSGRAQPAAAVDAVLDGAKRQLPRLSSGTDRRAAAPGSLRADLRRFLRPARAVQQSMHLEPPSLVGLAGRGADG